MVPSTKKCQINTTKFFALAALLAVAHAGGPAAYSTYSASGDLGSIGASQETTLKGLGGNNVLSQYSKAVDSPYSSVRISSSRASNDAIAYGAGYGLAAPALAAPAYAAGYGLAAPALAAPALRGGLSYGATGSSIGSSLHGHAAYGVSRLAAPAYAAPALAAPLAARAYAPALAAPLAARAIAAPAIGYSAAPAVAHVSFNGLGGVGYAF